MSDHPTASADPQRLAEEIEQLEYQNDVLAARLARLETANDEFVPGAVIKRFDAGEIPTLVWREYRGVSPKELAGAAGIAEADLRRIEDGEWDPGLGVMARIARALRVELDELVPWPQNDGES